MLDSVSCAILSSRASRKCLLQFRIQEQTWHEPVQLAFWTQTSSFDNRKIFLLINTRVGFDIINLKRLLQHSSLIFTMKMILFQIGTRAFYIKKTHIFKIRIYQKTNSIQTLICIRKKTYIRNFYITRVPIMKFINNRTVQHQI